MRPHYLPRTPKKAKRSILGGLLAKLGFARRPASTSNVVRLADVDPKYLSLLQERAKYRSSHAKGAREAQTAIEARVLDHLQRGMA